MSSTVWIPAWNYAPKTYSISFTVQKVSKLAEHMNHEWGIPGFIEYISEMEIKRTTWNELMDLMNDMHSIAESICGEIEAAYDEDIEVNWFIYMLT